MSTDGVMFVIKNGNIKQRELSEEEAEKYATINHELGPEIIKLNPGKKEKPLVITVKKE